MGARSVRSKLQPVLPRMSDVCPEGETAKAGLGGRPSPGFFITSRQAEGGLSIPDYKSPGPAECGVQAGASA